METTRRLAARATRFALGFRSGSDTGIFAVFIVLALVGSFSPAVWLVCLAVGGLLVARGFYADRARRAEAIEARWRSSYERRYLNL